MLIDTHKMVTREKEALTEMVVPEIGMEAEGQLVPREEVTGAGLLPMTVLVGQHASRRLNATNVVVGFFNQNL